MATGGEPVRDRQERISRATEIIAAQVGCSELDAMTLLMRRAAHDGTSMDDVALAVIVGTINFAAD